MPLSLSDVFGPTNVLINISESRCLSLLPTSLKQLISHGSHHLRRIYPKGIRIGSSNFNPLMFWRNGSHVASLNWQVYDRGMQVNEAMFVGSPGWIEKPLHMRKGSEYVPKKGREKLIGEVVGISSCSCLLFRLLLFDHVQLTCFVMPQCRLLMGTPVNPFLHIYLYSFYTPVVIWNGVQRR